MAAPTLSPSSAVAEGFQLLPLAQLRESPLNPRRHFDERALEDLAESIRTHGVLTPLLARPLTLMDRLDRFGEEELADGPAYELAAGHRRFRAAQRAGVATVPVIVREMTDEQFLEVLTVENLQREDVPPLDEAHGYQRLLELPGYDVAAIAAKVGKSASYVYARLALCGLAEPVKNAIWAGRLPVSHATVIGRLPADHQAKALELAFLYGGETPRPLADFRDLLRQELHVALEGAPFDPEDATLLPTAGACSACAKCTGNAPALFAELQGARECTDRSCFDAKTQAHVAREVERAAAAGTPLVQLTTRWGHRPVKEGKPIPAGQWHAAKPGAKGVVRGILVDGFEVGKVVDVRLQLAKPEPKRETQAAAPKPPAPRDWQLEAKIRDETERRARAQILAQVTTLDRPLLAVVADAMYPVVHGVAEAELRELVGLPAAKRTDWRKARTEFVQAIAAADEAVVAKALAFLAMCEDLSDRDGPGAALAARYNVDLKAITRAVTAELTPKPKPAKKPAKPAAKKRAGDVAREKKAKQAKAAKKKATAAAAATETPAPRAAKAKRAAATPDFMKPFTPSPELAAIVGAEPLPRTEVTKRLWTYIKKHGLQDKQERRMIHADDRLRPIFGGKDRVSMFDMTKLVKQHLS